ncbi:hypothetical protein OBV_21150 [Oscillibacter valericigenes Sjm18-20]|nr:hypothetical protein OBV_21150 [Oscillibacter valericigenes Sjm18-20]
MNSEGMRRSPALTVEQDLLAQEALWRLLRRQAGLYAPESSSLPAETAAALVESIRLTLGADRDPKVLLSADLNQRFRLGQHRLFRKIELSKQLWRTACLTLPEMENRSLTDTLRSIGGFGKRYNVRFFAQEIPCDIDYQLSQPVPETLSGVDYLNEWLRRLCLEQEFLRRFDQPAARAVVARSCPDYRRLLINLFEPVAVNTLGLALLGEDPQLLSVSPPLRRKLEMRFAPLTEAECNAALSVGADALCAGLGIQNQQTVRYLNGLASGLRPRLRAALTGGTLEHIFLEI